MLLKWSLACTTNVTLYCIISKSFTSFKVDEMIGPGQKHSISAVIVLNAAGQKCIKLCCSKSSANAAKSQERRHNDTTTLQPWEITLGFLSLTEGEKASDHSATSCGLVYWFPTPKFSLSLSPLLMHTAAHWPENRHIPVPSSPSHSLYRSLKAQTLWLRASLDRHSFKQFVSRLQGTCDVVAEEEN